MYVFYVHVHVHVSFLLRKCSLQKEMATEEVVMATEVSEPNITVFSEYET